MVQLGQEVALPLDLLGDLAVLFPHPLQGVAHLHAPVLHQPRRAQRARAHDAHVPEAAQLHVRPLLQLQPPHQLLPHEQRHYGRELLLVQRPELRRGARGLQRCSAPLLHEDGSLAEGRARTQRSDELAVDGELHHPLGDDVERHAHLPLPYNRGTAQVVAQRHGADQLVDLRAGERAEQWHLPHDCGLPHVVEDLVVRGAGAQADDARVPEDLREALFLQDGDEGAPEGARADGCRAVLLLLQRGVQEQVAPPQHDVFLSVVHAVLREYRAVDDDHHHALLLDVFVRAIRLLGHGVGQPPLLHLRQVRHVLDLLEHRDQKVALQELGEVLAQDLLQLGDPDADELAEGLGDDGGAPRLVVHGGTLAEAVAGDELRLLLAAL
mmetsp:Transcript_62676/g.175188  ORF Transcript_62676/g.175188 Transcript_62676/m.175188 type:complete len:382 (+) Transcript_62676:329-1474(+)